MQQFDIQKHSCCERRTSGFCVLCDISGGDTVHDMDIENDLYRLELDPSNGAVRRLLDKRAELELIAEPRLAESFRLLLPLPDLEANYILSTEQAAPEIEATNSGLAIRWDGPLTNARGSHDLAVRVEIEFLGETVQFRIMVDNKTSHCVAEVWHAGLGGIMGLGDRQQTKVMIPQHGKGVCEDLFQNFPESMGIGAGGGMRFPEFYAEYPGSLSMLWTDVYNPSLKCGMYFACLDAVPRVSALHFEMHPGMARKRLSGNWPTDDEIAAMADDFPAGVVMHWVHLPYTKPGEQFSGPPVVMQCHAGDWHAAAKIYRAWFLSQFPVRKAEDSWLRQQQAVQDAMFLLPEGNVMLTFKDIPQWARDAADYGVKAVMISGWNVGGHDNQYPNYTPDPRLGSWDDLAEAIAACHAMGVKVFFFSNIQFVDTSTDWYRSELERYRAVTSRGRQVVGGWGMGTLGARMGYTCPPCGVCEPAFPEYRKIIVDQMRKLAEIGADGIHYDKVGGGAMDFNPGLDISPDEAHPGGIIQCIEETLETCRRIRPDFCLGIESHWDRLLSYCDAWWLWFDDEHAAVMKYTFPEFLPTFATAQPWDFANVNRAVQYGYQILVGPVRFSASMADAQNRVISAYIREIIRIREELKDVIFFGEFLDRLEVDVRECEHLCYAAHRNPDTGKRACVLVNHSSEPIDTAVVFEGNDSGRVRIYRPFQDVAQQEIPAEFSIPAERLAIVVEE